MAHELDDDLSWVTMNGDIDAVRRLIEEGADVNMIDNDGSTPLMHASRDGYTEIVTLLLEKGADIHAKDEDGNTALTSASERGHTETARLLLDAGADVNGRNILRSTPPLIAASRMLLIYENENNDNTTALRVSNIEIVKLLLERGADVNVKDFRGETPLIVASSDGNIEIVKLLLEHGAEINKNAINKANNTVKPILRAWVRGKHLNRATTVLNKLNNTSLPRLPKEIHGEIASFFSGTNGKKGVQYGPRKPGSGTNYIGNQKRELEEIIGGTRKRSSRRSRKSRKRSRRL